MAVLFRLVSNGRNTYAELDGKVLGKHLESIEFICDATGAEKITRVLVRGDLEADLKEGRDDFDRITDLMREAPCEEGTPLTVEVIRPIS